MVGAGFVKFDVFVVVSDGSVGVGVVCVNGVVCDYGA